MRIAVGSALIYALVLSTPAVAQCSYPGIKPYVQSGCANLVPDCACNSAGQCGTVWRCVASDFGHQGPAAAPQRSVPFIDNNPALDAYNRARQEQRLDEEHRLRMRLLQRQLQQ
jgi:hypothetical protein